MGGVRRPHLTVDEVRLYERDIRLRMPFRYGMVTLTEAPQLFARARIRLEGGGASWGNAAEMLAPKWFDKNPALSNADNFAQLRTAVAEARALYLGDGAPRTAFGLFAAHHRAQLGRCAARGLNPLVAGFGPALLDRAVLDALCRVSGVSVYDAVRANLPGVTAGGLAPDLEGFALDEFLASLRPRDRVHARHTIGLVDPIGTADQRSEERVGDGLPETLEEVIRAYGHRYFKIKVGGDPRADVERLTAIAAVLDRIPGGYQATLDGNEQYREVDGVLELWDRMETTPALARLLASILYIEQPLARQVALARNVRPVGARRPVIIDESDAALEAFVTARECGYRGVSSKTCKGLYKSLLNLARCHLWSQAEGRGAYFMSGEDLTCQAGVAVQQDLALVALLGLEHVERNGHHYVNGMAAAPPAEQAAFRAAHPDLYRVSDHAVRLHIEGGELAIGSLACPGLAVAADPDWSSMRPVSG